MVWQEIEVLTTGTDWIPTIVLTYGVRYRLVFYPYSAFNLLFVFQAHPSLAQSLPRLARARLRLLSFLYPPQH